MHQIVKEEKKLEMLKAKSWTRGVRFGTKVSNNTVTKSKDEHNSGCTVNGFGQKINEDI